MSLSHQYKVTTPKDNDLSHITVLLYTAQTHSMAASWADQMDELASPVGDGLTLMGADGQRFKSPSPSPQGQGSNEPSRPEDRQEAIEPAKPIEIVRR